MLEMNEKVCRAASGSSKLNFAIFSSGTVFFSGTVAVVSNVCLRIAQISFTESVQTCTLYSSKTWAISEIILLVIGQCTRLWRNGGKDPVKVPFFFNN